MKYVADQDNHYKVLQVFNIIGFSALVLVNFLANYLPLNGKTTGEIAGLYPNLFTPAAFTFSIWILIYVLLAIFVFCQANGIFSKNGEEFVYVKKIGFLFFSSCLLNMAWLFAWHYLQISLSLVIMIFLLINLIVLYNRLNQHDRVEKERGSLIVRLAISIYLGWITIATIANVTTLLVYLDWNRFGLSEVFWTVVVLLLTVIIVMIFMLKNSDRLYGLVAIWALFGIIYQRLTVEPIEYTIVIVSGIGILIIIAGVIKAANAFSSG